MYYYDVYASSAVRPFSTAELVALLERAQANNIRRGLTGMLLYKDGNFMQVLEGDEATVRNVMVVIEHDPRHHGILRLLHGQTEHRQFPDWSMGFRDLNSPGVHEIEGYSEFMNSPLNGADMVADPSRAQRLLATFRRTM